MGTAAAVKTKIIDKINGHPETGACMDDAQTAHSQAPVRHVPVRFPLRSRELSNSPRGLQPLDSPGASATARAADIVTDLHLPIVARKLGSK